MHQLGTTLRVFFKNLSKSVILLLAKSYIRGSIEINCISLSNEFGANVYHSLVERSIINWKLFSTFVVVGVVDTEIVMCFIKLPFYKQIG